MGRLVFGKNRWAMLTNGSSYPKTSSWAVTGTNDFMLIPLRNMDNPNVMNRGRLLLCVDSVWKERKEKKREKKKRNSNHKFCKFRVQKIFVHEIFFVENRENLPIAECLALLLWDLYPSTTLVQSLIFSCVDNSRYHCCGKRYSLFPYPLCVIITRNYTKLKKYSIIYRFLLGETNTHLYTNGPISCNFGFSLYCKKFSTLVMLNM